MKKETEILKTPVFTVVEKEFKDTALNIVCKVANVNRRNVEKISNNKNKMMCHSSEYVEYLKHAIDWRINSDK